MALGTRFTLAPFRVTVAGNNDTAINATDDSLVVDMPGLVVMDQLGNFYRYILNDSTVTAAGDLMTASHATTATDIGPTSYKIEVTGDGSLAGPFALALGVITAAQWGWVLVTGVGTAHLKGTTAVGDALAASAATALKLVKIADAAPPPIAVATALEIKTDADGKVRMLGINL